MGGSHTSIVTYPLPLCQEVLEKVGRASGVVDGNNGVSAGDSSDSSFCGTLIQLMWCGLFR